MTPENNNTPTPEERFRAIFGENDLDFSTACLCKAIQWAEQNPDGLRHAAEFMLDWRKNDPHYKTLTETLARHNNWVWAADDVSASAERHMALVMAYALMAGQFNATSRVIAHLEGRPDPMARPEDEGQRSPDGPPGQEKLARGGHRKNPKRGGRERKQSVQ
jgi:hypothetical protein